MSGPYGSYRPLHATRSPKPPVDGIPKTPVGPTWRVETFPLTGVLGPYRQTSVEAKTVPLAAVIGRYNGAGASSRWSPANPTSFPVWFSLSPEVVTGFVRTLVNTGEFMIIILKIINN